uniref:Uncharacterized protein n=1 Tax=Oryza nivara TaxID=4536 RepID=A0A0E0HP98_ORYNI
MVGVDFTTDHAGATRRTTPASARGGLTREAGGWWPGLVRSRPRRWLAEAERAPSLLGRTAQLMRALLSLCQDSKDEDEDDDHDGQRECSRVAVEEHKVSAILAIPDDGVTSEVPGLGVLPDTPRRAESCTICHRGHKGGQQKEVLPQIILQW